ncbi:MAG: aldo/keto reductase [Candidatus Aenigmatarchaeota archaeon]
MKMQYKTLGKTGLKVSAIGFGGIPIQKTSEKEAIKIIQKASKLGINFIDTARVYGNSESKIGITTHIQRDQWIIASKSPARSYKDMWIDLKESLKQLKTNYIDLYQLHHVSKEEDLEQCLSKNGSYNALIEAKKKGIIKHIGITGHDSPVLLKAMKTGKFETVMIPYSYRNQEAEKELIPYCKKHNIGIIVMKPLDGGTVKHPTSAIRFCLTKPISVVIPGIYTDKELKEDVENVLKSKLTKKESLLLKKDKQDKGYYCRSCGYCSVIMHGRCPQEINIMFFIRAEAYLKKYGPKKWLIELCNTKTTNLKNCILCGHCENVCPYNLPIMRILKDLKLNKFIKEKPTLTNQSSKSELKERVHREMGEFDNIAKKNKIKQTPYINWKYKRSSNPGQKTTVLNHISKIPQHDQEKLFQKLKKEMKIIHATNLRELVMLSDYDNIVDMMRAFQEYFDNKLTKS